MSTIEENNPDQEDNPDQGTQPQPLLKIVKGNPTPEELAALVAVVASLGAAEAPAPKRTPEWSANHRRTRPTYSHGPGGWRSSGLPR